MTRNMNGARFPVRAVLFDLDGTLIDTVSDLTEAANRMLSEMGRPARSEAQIRMLVGRGIPDLVRRCMTEGGTASEAEVADALTRFRRHYAVVNGQHSGIYPGVIATLQVLKASGLALAVVTNKAAAFTAPLLELMGIDGFFDAVVSGDTLPVTKPDPAVLKHACTLLGVAEADAIMVGDSANDARAARAAGMPVLLVSYGYSEGMPVDTIECDGLLSAAADLLQHIQPASAA